MKNTSFRGRSALALILFLLIVSCTMKDGPDTFLSETVENDLSSTFVRASPPPLYAKLPGDQETKGDAGTVRLESVLDRIRSKKTAFKDVSAVQIPFSMEYSGQKAYFGGEPEGNPEEAAVMKRFLIVVGEEMSVVTMVTDYEYWRSYPSFDYLDKPDYTGAVVFSKVSGEFVRVQLYDSGRIMPAGFVSGTGTGDLSYIVVYASDTRASGGDEVVGRYTVSVAGEGEDSPWYWDPDGTTPSVDEAAPLEKQCSVSLSCDIPDEVQMTGGGLYTTGSTVIIGYSQKHSVKTLVVDHWTGDFAWSKSSRFSHKVTGDLVATAYFEAEKPYMDNSKHIANPLLGMRIAASNVSMAKADADDSIYANYYGGTFGETRTDLAGNPKRHDGLDLYAEVGTPVYAAFSGTVMKAECRYGSEHVSNSYGNELRISTTEKGKVIVYQYAHLQGGTPFAVNPRTGQPFKVDDKVFQGDLIGYSGRSGNATDVPNPHLHFGVMAGGKWVDPKPYINGTYPSGRKAIDRSKGLITGIRRD